LLKKPAVPAGLILFGRRRPGVETPGYCQSPLCGSLQNMSRRDVGAGRTSWRLPNLASNARELMTPVSRISPCVAKKQAHHTTVNYPTLLENYALPAKVSTAPRPIVIFPVLRPLLDSSIEGKLNF